MSSTYLDSRESIPSPMLSQSSFSPFGTHHESLGQARGGTRAHQSEAVDRDVGVAVRATFSCEAR